MCVCVLRAVISAGVKISRKKEKKTGTLSKSIYSREAERD
jgi:hypothetical protein